MPEQITRRRLLALIPASIVSLAGGKLLAQTGQATQNPLSKEAITVYKDPNCGCCQKWVEHMEANGYKAAVTNVDMKPIKAKFKVPADLESCHTTIIRGYVIEGHVPAADVKKFLASKPKGVLGLTIPGMPASAPGMDGKPFRPYDVLSFDSAGKTALFARHTKA